MALTFNSVELKIFLSKNNIEPYNMVIFDDNYAALSKSWLLSKGLGLLKYYMTKNKLLSDYKKHGWDCDDFALVTMSIVRLLHAKHCPEKNLKNYTPAFGLFSYLYRLNEPHAINLCIARNDSNELEVVFIEPQLFSKVSLTDKEIGTCKDVII